MRIRVQAPTADVVAVLADTLTPEELALLAHESAERPTDPFDVTPRRGVALTTVAIWIASTVASGATYDLARAAFRKARRALEERFGTTRVEQDETEE